MKILLLGSGELGREFTIEAIKHGHNVVAVDSYAGAPAMGLANFFHVGNMQDEDFLREIVEMENPDAIVPEIEAINTDYLTILEEKGTNIVPSAKAVSLTMNRDGIRDFVKTLGVKTSNFEYAETLEEYVAKTECFDYPFIVKPCMSSSGKGQSVVKYLDASYYAFDYAIKNSRGESKKIIIEEFINFDFEITLLAYKSGKTFFCCDPIMHFQKNGDYHWSSQNTGVDFSIDPVTLLAMESTVELIVNKFGGDGLFGAEFFIKRNHATNRQEFYFSEISPRPHDTGLVTLISQNMSEFELHLRAITGLPTTKEDVISYGGCSATINVPLEFSSGTFDNELFSKLLTSTMSNTHEYFSGMKFILFGKTEARAGRRMGVILGKNLEMCLLLQEAASRHMFNAITVP